MKPILTLTVLALTLALCACNNPDPVQRTLNYRSLYDVELLGFNVRSDDDGNPVAVNMELSVKNNNPVAALSVLTLRVRQYGAGEQLLGEDLLALPLKGLKPYREERYYPVLKKVHGNITAVSVTKAPVDDPAVYMKYREFEGLPKQ